MLLAGAIYLSGIDFGLPYFLHADEENLLTPVVVMRDNKTFEVKDFVWPAHVPVKVLMFAFFILERIVGLPSGVIYAEQRHLLMLTSRLVTVLWAVGMVPLAYAIGRRNNERTGWLCAVLVALLPVLVKHAHYATPDIPLTFLMLLLILLGLRYHASPTYPNLFFMCACASAAFATKYPGAFYYVCVAVSVLVCAAQMQKADLGAKLLRVMRHGAFAIFSALVSLFAISPSMLLNPGEVFKWLFEQNDAGDGGHSYFDNMLYYARQYLNFTGLILLAALVFGVVMLAKNRAVLLSNVPLFYGVVFWLLLNVAKLQKSHWGLPMYVSLLTVTAFGIDAFLRMAKTNTLLLRHRAWLRPATALCAALSLGSLLSADASVLTGFLVTDSREVGALYCAENGITRDNTAFTMRTPAPLTPAYGDELFEDVLIADSGQYQITRAYIRHVVVNHDRITEERQPIEDALQADYRLEHRIQPPHSPSDSPVEAVNIWRNVGYTIQTIRAGVVGDTLDFYSVDKSNLYAYPLGSPIYFNKYDMNSDTYCIRGLQEAEEAGAWSDGFAVDFIFYVPQTVGDLRLELEADPMVSPRYTWQTVEFYAGDTLVDTIVMTERGQYSVTIPKSCITDGVLSLRIGLPDAIEPARISNDNPDDRVLALLFREMRMTEA